MSRIKRARPSPALVIAVLALIVAIGGTGYAASKVGGKDLKAFKVRGENPTIVQPGETKTVTRSCKKGERYISGGWFINGSDIGVPPATFDIIVAGPQLNQKSKPTGFVWSGTNKGGEAHEVFASAVCLKR